MPNLRQGIILKSPQEIKIMRQAGKALAATLEVLEKAIKPGMNTRELDKLAEKELRRWGAIASFKGYRGFPASLCVSINEEVVHGIPGERVLKEGDIVSLDLGAILDSFQADAAVTVGVGRITPEAQALIQTTQEVLERGIAAARAGARVGDISWAIQSLAESQGFSVVREYVGHGIGREMHEEPQVPNFGLPGRGPLLLPGMTLALEPMLTVGGWKTRVKENGWTVVTLDNSLSAHFEHTIAISDAGPEVLT